jgi:hypothetical protein
MSTLVLIFEEASAQKRLLTPLLFLVLLEGLIKLACSFPRQKKGQTHTECQSLILDLLQPSTCRLTNPF